MALAALTSGAGAAAAATAEPRTILVLGDSLSAGYGVPMGRGWVDLLAADLARRSPPLRVVNASVSGETTFGGLARLPALLDAHKPRLLVLELGANDALRGTDLGIVHDNLARLVALGRQAGARVLVLGMRIPPNYGPAYAEGFHALFARVARGRGVGLVPFLLEDVARERSLFQDDGIHPTEAAQPRLLARVLPALDRLLASPAR